MRAKYWLLGTIVFCGWLATSVSAQQAVRWQPNLQTAKQAAAQSNRLVLIHFWAPSCTGCMKMDQEVFSRSDVAAALEANYVPVKLNADYFPNTARQYGVTALPTDLIVTPQGQPVEKLVGFKSGPEYITAMNWIANKANGAGPRSYAQIAGSPEQNAAPPAPVGGPNLAGGADNPGPAAAPYLPPYATGYPPSQPGAAQPDSRGFAPPLAAASPPQGSQFPGPSGPPPSYGSPPPAFPNGFPLSGGPAVPPSGQPDAPGQTGLAPQAGLAVPPTSTAQAPPSFYPFGLDGCCPVALREKKQWVRGDRRWGAIHQGMTYLFVGPDEQQRFLKTPDLYAPVLAGNDPVLMVDQGQAVPGQRRYGAWYGDRVYLFSSEASFQRFYAEAPRYSSAVLQSLRPTPNTSYR